MLPAWYNREGYINAMARLIAAKIDKIQARAAPPRRRHRTDRWRPRRAALAARDGGPAARPRASAHCASARGAVRAQEDNQLAQGEAHVFFSAHGLPVKYIDELGDPYKAQTEANAEFVMKRLHEMGYENQWTLAYQSRVRRPAPPAPGRNGRTGAPRPARWPPRAPRDRRAGALRTRRCTRLLRGAA